MELNASAWRGRRVLITGHTGFKGSWLALWLAELGAQVTGFSLPPPTRPSLFELAKVAGRVRHIEGDIRDDASLKQACTLAEPEVVFHMAAQSLVRESYRNPVETFQTNLLGTVNVLEACRSLPFLRGVLVVTSDKCYENHEGGKAYSEGDPLGGRDPYSSSKACAEIASAAYRQSFFSGTAAPLIATARAGNVIGGGDYAADRLIPDLVRAASKGERLVVRNPRAVRPWQHVLEPLAGYLQLADRLCANDRPFAEGWNFGPDVGDARPVEWVLERALKLFGLPPSWDLHPDPAFPEAGMLTLDSSKARNRLGWRPRLRIDQALAWTMDWYGKCRDGANPETLTLQQIRQYMASPVL
ncbi:MAG: CDP-glucose 4,6-dehydratase [Acidobacteria bacterium RIFCSPLOWO2_02_FULL_59_13]|nr:MAG: CDP-glucose 4,6-dehydratase [Acidobacteria bacterium RIFCSPLOWO2_02_FULL_59_13]OGA68039.1 MAG: CDP-glucose 4,6-dehydratase [Betaproteobacteria bacterium RIFCSPLOWO2_12_FULL_65_14]